MAFRANRWRRAPRKALARPPGEFTEAMRVSGALHDPGIVMWLANQSERLAARGYTLFFTNLSGTRRQPTKFFRSHEVPEIEEDDAWFEIDRGRGRSKFIRKVEPPAWAR